MIHFLTHYADKIESVQFSDQFSGPKLMQEYVSLLPVATVALSKIEADKLICTVKPAGMHRKRNWEQR